MMSKAITLSPSDFVYLKDWCPRCYWLKCHGYKPLKDDLQPVFRVIDAAMKAYLTPDVLQDMGVPAVARVAAEYVRSRFFHVGAVELCLSTKPDCVYMLEDGTAAVVEAKCTNADEAYLTKFQRQLGSYIVTLENPEKGTALQVTQAMLCVLNPSPEIKASQKSNAVALMGTFDTYSFPVDALRRSVQDELEAVAKIVTGPMPESGSRCMVCNYIAKRESFIKRLNEDADN